MTLPSVARFLILQHLRKFSLLTMFFTILFASNLFVKRKITPQVSIESEVKLMLLIPYSPIFTLFSTTIPATSHFDLPGLGPEKRICHILSSSATYNSSLKRNVNSSVYSLCKIVSLHVSNHLIFVCIFLFVKHCNSNLMWKIILLCWHF